MGGCVLFRTSRSKNTVRFPERTDVSGADFHKPPAPEERRKVKSEYAENLITSSLFSNRIYLAAMEAWGEEGRKRVLRHRRLRQGKGFFTIERPRNLKGVLDGRGEDAAVLLECMSNLAANELFLPSGMRNALEAEDSIKEGICHLEENSSLLVVVTNEIFSDGVDYGPETGEYIRLLGRMNVWLAERADAVVKVTAGIPEWM